MTMATEETGIALTPAQQAVVELPWDAKILVTAGAGAGKTTTLIRRLERLIREEELQAADILVLSFSRAAVREVSDRLHDRGVAARRVRAQTFDSWSTSVLYQEDPQRTDLIRIGYDRRVDMACKAIGRGVVEESERGEPKHVIIDEVQDLVGVRRELVEVLLEQFPYAGFTVMGDVAQSIYAFQIRDPHERARETALFLDWLRVYFQDELVECTLGDNFRAGTAEARIALDLGPRLQRMRTDDEAEALFGELSARLETVPWFGSFEDTFVQDSLRDVGGTTAILCQYNKQVLALSRDLDKYSIPHRVKRSGRERPAPSWLAALFDVVAGGEITEERFNAAIEEFDKSVPRPPAFAWRSLRRVAPAPGNRLDLFALRNAVVKSRLPDELTALGEHSLTLSTIHGAKGMEFDRVLVVEPTAPKVGDPDGDIQAAARLLYVAMTRPRRDLFRLERPNTWTYHKSSALPSHAERWYTSGRAPWMRTGIELLDFDVAQDRPGQGEAPDLSAVAIQQYLRERVHDGDRLDFRRLHNLPVAADETPAYGLFHHGVRVGDASAAFRRDLRKLLRKGDSGPWPVAITDVRVDLVHTVVGSAGVGAQAGLGDVDSWVAPRLGGMGRIQWHADDEISEGPVES